MDPQGLSRDWSAGPGRSPHGGAPWSWASPRPHSRRDEVAPSGKSGSGPRGSPSPRALQPDPTCLPPPPLSPAPPETQSGAQLGLGQPIAHPPRAEAGPRPGGEGPVRQGPRPPSAAPPLSEMAGDPVPCQPLRFPCSGLCSGVQGPPKPPLPPAPPLPQPRSLLPSLDMRRLHEPSPPGTPCGGRGGGQAIHLLGGDTSLEQVISVSPDPRLVCTPTPSCPLKHAGLHLLPWGGPESRVRFGPELTSSGKSAAAPLADPLAAVPPSLSP